MASQAGQLSLLARNGFSLRWSNFGVIQAESAGWLREFLKTNDGRAKTPPRAWPLVSPVQAVPDSTGLSKRIGLIAPSLESDDPLVAGIAFAELSRTPYEVMRALKTALGAADLRRWISRSRPRKVTECLSSAPRHRGWHRRRGDTGRSFRVPRLLRGCPPEQMAKEFGGLSPMPFSLSVPEIGAAPSNPDMAGTCSGSNPTRNLAFLRWKKGDRPSFKPGRPRSIVKSSSA
ncbi:hypothetical protein CHELA1G11_12062 [Hyphomicrobiales bacterium]|nr:hypothetical protein CHELA1G11_12062 [Hyphomicrobiales bacterium]CAH1663566.1 hypothetical protein CHELA1G2_12251 [Hyphomicrobiales bacterium]